MGWSGGTDIAETLISLAEEFVPTKHQYEFLLQGFRALEDHDWDNASELYYYRGKIRDTVLEVLNTLYDTDEYT